MARRYDSRTTIFSPEGRLYQVEYAMEAIGHAGSCLGILANDGILLAAERRNTNKLLDEVFHSEKIYRLNENMACSVAGITSDANVLTNELRLIGQRYFYQVRRFGLSSDCTVFKTVFSPQLQYEETMPCEQLVSFVCDIKQAYTQYGGKRPFGVSILYMGWDKQLGYQLYQSDPSGKKLHPGFFHRRENSNSSFSIHAGNYSGWKATCIGNNSSAAVSQLKQEYKEGEMSLKDALDLSIKTLSKTLDMTKLTPDKIELSTLQRKDGKTEIRILPADEVEELIKKYEAAEKAAEEAKREKEKQAQKKP